MVESPLTTVDSYLPPFVTVSLIVRYRDETVASQLTTVASAVLLLATVELVVRDELVLASCISFFRHHLKLPHFPNNEPIMP